MKKKKINSLTIEGCVFTAMGIALLIYSIKNNAKIMQQYWSISPYMLPSIIAVLMIVLGAVLIVKGIVALAAENRKVPEAAQTNTAEKENKNSNQIKWKSVFISFALALVYFIILPYIHFLPATILFLAAFLWFLGERKVLNLILIPVITSGVLYVLFGVLLHVMLP